MHWDFTGAYRPRSYLRGFDYDARRSGSRRAADRPAFQPQRSGGTVARAKRTDRADARRRYRAQVTAESDPIDDDTAEAESTERPKAEPVRTAAPAPGERVPLGTAFRLAFRPAHVREDLRKLPRLVLDKSVWLPLLLTVGSTVAAILFKGQPLPVLAAQFFVLTPPIASIFLAGFLAPTAGYLTGFIAGLAGAVCWSIILLTLGSDSAVTGTPIPPEVINQQIASAFVISPISGILFGGAAAWYKRFLNLANPNRQRPPSQSQTRSGRRPSDQGRRPFLARRR
jgi:hypothetical protein